MRLPEYETKDLNRLEDLDNRVTPFQAFASQNVERALILVTDLQSALPDQVVYRPTAGSQDVHVLKNRDKLLVMALLSTWKSLRLLEATTGAWRNRRPSGFDPFMGVTAVRAALEEVARTEKALEALEPVCKELGRHPLGHPASDRAAATLDVQLDKLNQPQGGTGLAGSAPGSRESVGQLITAVTGLDKAVGRNLYSYLSAVAHAEGPGRTLLRSGSAYLEGEWLTRDASKHVLRSAVVACAAGLAITGLSLDKHWSKVEILVNQLEVLGAGRGTVRSNRLSVPPENWYEAEGKVPVSMWRDGVWTYWKLV